MGRLIHDHAVNRRKGISAMTVTSAISDTAFRSLEQSLTGSLIRPSDAAYDSARAVWNGMIDRKPAVIVRCAETSDVARAIGFAGANGLPVAVRGGGHNAAGLAMSDNG